MWDKIKKFRKNDLIGLVCQGKVLFLYFSASMSLRMASTFFLYFK